MNGHPPTDERPYAKASIRERRGGLAVSLVLIAFGMAAVPLGGRYVGETPALVPAICMASFVTMIVSATILRNQYRTSGFVPYAFLGVAYGATALLLLPYMLTFPGVFSPDGFGAGSQAAPWLWVGSHATFILLSGAYVWAESYFTRTAVAPERSARIVRNFTTVVAVLLGSGVEAVAYFHRALPVLTIAGSYSPLFHQVVEGLLLASCAAVFATLVMRTSLAHATHLWLGVVLIALATEVYVGGDVVRDHASLAWYMQLFEGVAWQAMFLVVQLRHANDQLAAFAADKRHLIEATLRDALTGLYNRRGFDQKLVDATSECKLARAPIAMLVLDIDCFKAYNDYYGHPMGDDALRRVGQTIAQIANRPTDACCRVGGDEFAIVLAMTDAAGAKVVAERLRAAIARLRMPHAPTHTNDIVTISVGIAVDRGATQAAGTLHERADQALYRAKNLGRNRVAVEAEMHEAVLRAV